MSKITPFLWFDKNLKEITDFYLSVFPDAKLSGADDLSDTPSGDVQMASLEIFGQRLNLMTAGPMFKFNEAISFVVSCEDQKEVDYYWAALTAGGGSEGSCGWLKDRYGLSWQVVPTALGALMAKADGVHKKAITQAFLKMKKFDIVALEQAAAS